MYRERLQISVINNYIWTAAGLVMSQYIIMFSSYYYEKSTIFEASVNVHSYTQMCAKKIFRELIQYCRFMENK